MLRRKRGLCATVESCTGGLLASELTDVPGASDVFWGGVVTYHDPSKRSLARVPASVLAKHGAISKPAAVAMARGGLALLKRRPSATRADLLIAIATTGLAGPKGIGKHPIGTCFIALAFETATSGAGKSGNRTFFEVIHVKPKGSPPQRRTPAQSRVANKRRFVKRAIAAAIGLVIASGCASESTSSHTEHVLHRVALDTIHFRRPVGASAQDDVYPDEEGYRSFPPPSGHLDCQSLPGFFHAIDLTKLRDCLSGIKTSSKAVYRLELETQPSLVLDNTDKAPACIKELLPALPVPREIVFQNNEEKTLSCYSAHLDLSEGKVFGISNPFKHTYVEIELPLASDDLVATPARAVNLLASWVLTPFFSGEPREVLSKLVPNRLCQTCFGEMVLLKPEDRPVYWPDTDGNP